MLCCLFGGGGRLKVKLEVMCMFYTVPEMYLYVIHCLSLFTIFPLYFVPLPHLFFVGVGIMCLFTPVSWSHLLYFI
jgi:hypothetical protein